MMIDTLNTFLEVELKHKYQSIVKLFSFSNLVHWTPTYALRPFPVVLFAFNETF